MIARMRSLLADLRTAPPAPWEPALAAACIVLGMRTLSKFAAHQRALIAEGNRDLAQLFNRIGEQQLRLVALREEILRAQNEHAAYPQREDLDPLGRGADDDGQADELADEQAAPAQP